MIELGLSAEKRVAYTGSKKVQSSRIEKGLDVSRTGDGILSKIFNMMSCGKAFRLVHGPVPWAWGWKIEMSFTWQVVAEEGALGAVVAAAEASSELSVIPWAVGVSSVECETLAFKLVESEGVWTSPEEAGEGCKFGNLPRMPSLLWTSGGIEWLRTGEADLHLSSRWLKERHFEHRKFSYEIDRRTSLIPLLCPPRSVEALVWRCLS